MINVHNHDADIILVSLFAQSVTKSVILFNVICESCHPQMEAVAGSRDSLWPLSGLQHFPHHCIMLAQLIWTSAEMLRKQSTSMSPVKTKICFQLGVS